jgi:HNH endonuclease
MQYEKMSRSAQAKGGTTWWAKLFNRPQRWRPVSIEQRLKAGLVRDPDTGCLIWAGAKSGSYGYLTFGVHRLAWEHANGPIPEGMQVLHKCDEPRCCNPDHLFLGTQAENMADKVRKGRARNRHTGKIEAPRRRLRPPLKRQLRGR